MIRLTITLSALLLCQACSGPEGKPLGPGGATTAGQGQTPTTSSECKPASEAPAPEPLQWRRTAAFVADIHGALELDASTGCRELDQVPCADVHLVGLGGNDVFGAGQYQPVARPLATTPLVVDRFVLGACANRVTLDSSSEARVFTELDLAASTVAPNDAAVTATVQELYRRLLRRNPTQAEVDEVRTLAEGTSAKDFALAACFAIGTSTETVLF